MQGRSNNRTPIKRTDYVGQYAAYLSDTRNAKRLQWEQKQQLARRIGRMARVAIVATKTGATSKKRRIVAYKRRVSAGLRTIHQNQYRLVAGAFVILLGLSTTLAPFF